MLPPSTRSPQLLSLGFSAGHCGEDPVKDRRPLDREAQRVTPEASSHCEPTSGEPCAPVRAARCWILYAPFFRVRANSAWAGLRARILYRPCPGGRIQGGRSGSSTSFTSARRSRSEPNAAANTIQLATSKIWRRGHCVRIGSRRVLLYAPLVLRPSLNQTCTSFLIARAAFLGGTRVNELACAAQGKTGLVFANLIFASTIFLHLFLLSLPSSPFSRLAPLSMQIGLSLRAHAINLGIPTQ